jgi:hypothetical protein
MNDHRNSHGGESSEKSGSEKIHLTHTVEALARRQVTEQCLVERL